MAVIVLFGILLWSVGIRQSTATCSECQYGLNLNSTEGDDSLTTAGLRCPCCDLLTLPRSRCDPRCTPVDSEESIPRSEAKRRRWITCQLLFTNISRDLPQQNSTSYEGSISHAYSTSYEGLYTDVCLKDEQPPFVSPSSETGTRSSNLDPTPEKLKSLVLVQTTAFIIGVIAAGIAISVTLYVVKSRRRHSHREVYLDDRPTVSKSVPMDDRTARGEPGREETQQVAEPRDPPVVAMTCDSASTQAVRPEAQRELPRLLFLSDVIDDDPGAYMRSLHCDEIARIFRDAVTPVLQSHVTSGLLSEQASAELLERHVTETRDLADTWMGRWQRGVSEKLSLSDVWVTLLSMRKEALLQEVQGQVGRFSQGA